MTEPGHCPRCHVVLTADAPAGLCPSCLMQLALELTTDGPDQSSGSERFPAERFAPDMTISENLRSFGDYELLQPIARGGMGVIYKARQISLNQLQLSSEQLPEHVQVFGAAGQLWAANHQYNKHPNSNPPAIKLWRLAPERREVLLENPGYADLKLDFGEWFWFAGRNGLAVSPDGKFLVVACTLRWGSAAPDNSFKSIGEGTLELWDLTIQKRLAIWYKGSENPSRVSFSPDGKRVAACGGIEAPANVAIWDFTTHERLPQSPRQLDDTQGAEIVTFSADSRLLFSAGFRGNKTDGSIRVHEVETGRKHGVWNGHQGRALALAISPDGRLLASGGEDRTIRLWEISTGRELARWEAHQLGVTALAFSPDGRTLASGGADGTLKLWDLPFIRRELASLGLDW